uniref:Putative citrate synthase n=1 Tax=uncultured bacterium EIL102C09 TaxID=1768197 RepID=A0A0U2M5G8_9BACT|nr:putative citrate synthase [uncultured bacterium EIL102C09]
MFHQGHKTGIDHCRFRLAGHPSCDLKKGHLREGQLADQITAKTFIPNENVIISMRCDACCLFFRHKGHAALLGQKSLFAKR